MPDMQLRHKLRKVMDVASNGEQIPKRPKKIGFLIFSICAGIGLVGLLAFAVALTIYTHYISAAITFIIVGFLFYSTYKLITAKDIEIS
ncbi:hypothetical protein [Sporosarcina sp. G11-34]|uniref:hypothetical protein n=1 Tax=Sporosarcina sp. G11-34 TaxID=2849605 RepID=UPI0022A93CF7|nr:hypothetical protein [Sporosarcina sp. G11-34]MCZ2260656.1 hypothetical protein [Sporosarcina sp. G11-34]